MFPSSSDITMCEMNGDGATGTVTYAQLKFGDLRRNETTYGDGTLEHHNEDCDLMYENVDDVYKAVEQREKTHPPPPTPESKLMAGLRRRSAIWCLVLLLLCLALCVTVISLAVKYAQALSDLRLEENSQRTLSSKLNQCLRGKEDLQAKLSDSRTELEKNQMELNQMTREIVALNNSLIYSQQDVRNCTTRRKMSEEKMKDNQSQVDQCTSTLQDVREELRETESKFNQLERDLCGKDWVLYGKKCLWFSADKQTWPNSKKKCEGKNSNMIVVPWNDKALKAFLSGKGEEYWVGKEWKKSAEYWEWPYGYGWSEYYKISGGHLEPVDDDDYYYAPTYRWICEKQLVLMSQGKSP